MTTIHHSPPPGTTFQSFAIYEDPDDQEPPSPSIAYDEGASYVSEQSLPGEDEALESIEREDEHEQDFSGGPAPYRSSFTARPSAISAATSRRVSGVTANSFVSSLPSEMSVSIRPAAPANVMDSRYTPRKDRPPFRNPSSVRAMQMSSPPPFTHYDRPHDRQKGTYILATPSRTGRSETPVSASGSRRHRDSHGSAQSPRPAPPTAQQHLPLVLLHVTIIPMQFPYSPELMAKSMPEWLVENYKLLEEKLQDIVLMRRGLLISHPREEYDVLEERILESLELKTPRLLKCGHFVAPEDPDESGDDEEDDRDSVADDATGRGSRMSGGTLTVEEEGEWRHQTHNDAGVCEDCHRHVKRPGNGVGKGYKKWDLKIYAANGLMRAGAWSAAWSEMERCDVEISPWIPEDVRKSLDRKVIEQKEREIQKRMYEAEVLRCVEEETTRLKRIEDEAEEKRRSEEMELQRQTEAAAYQKKIDDEAAEKKKLDEVLNERIEQAKESIRLQFEMQALQEADAVAERFRNLEDALKKEQTKAISETSTLDPPRFDDRVRSQSRGRPRSSSSRPPNADIPIGTLLINYLLVLARDQRNLIIVVLGAGLYYLSTRMTPTTSSLNLTGMLPVDTFTDPVSTFVVVTTATSIQTSIEYVTVTQSIDAGHSPLSVVMTAEGLDSSIVSDAMATPFASNSVVSDAMANPAASDSVISDSVISDAVATPAASSSVISDAMATPAASDSVVSDAIATPAASNSVVSDAMANPAASDSAVSDTIANPAASSSVISDAMATPAASGSEAHEAPIMSMSESIEVDPTPSSEDTDRTAGAADAVELQPSEISTASQSISASVFEEAVPELEDSSSIEDTILSIEDLPEPEPVLESDHDTQDSILAAPFGHDQNQEGL